ncbi:protein of unknown function [Methylacidimicrobium sp. AP8]|nr:protein of unknown function [Methylacidimicrobium sp. AP8]
MTRPGSTSGGCRHLDWARRVNGPIAWFAWLAIHLVFLIGFRNKAVVLLEWAWAYLAYRPGARIILRPDDAPSPQERSPSASSATEGWPGAAGSSR